MSKGLGAPLTGDQQNYSTWREPMPLDNEDVHGPSGDLTLIHHLAPDVGAPALWCFEEPFVKYTNAICVIIQPLYNFEGK